MNRRQINLAAVFFPIRKSFTQESEAEMVLFQGRPQNTDGRMEIELKTYDQLDALGIPYVRADHDHADTMEVCEAIDQVLEVRICKNLFLCNRQKTSFYLLLMDADKPFKTKDLSKQLGVSRLSFASAEDMERLLDLTPGSVSVLALRNDPDNQVQLVIDKSVLEAEWFGCHPCINTSSLRFRTADLFEKILPALEHEPSFVELPWVVEE
jgi:Ala-tRNA(Pro) deacylase